MILKEGGAMDLTGIGLYTLKEAERLTGADAREAGRWLFGCRVGAGVSAPLWQTQLADKEIDGAKVIGFRDLLELRIVKAFTQHNVSLRVIRAAIASAKLIFSTEYPFTAHRFLTDGKSIFYEALKDHGEVEITDLARCQRVFEHIIRPELFAGIKFASDGQATRWFPVKKSEVIVLDPALAFGKPVLAEFGIRTDVLAACFAVEQDKKRVAALYNVPLYALNVACAYEGRPA
jgi:uncharacterized protein (DUF433 family)